MINILHLYYDLLNLYGENANTRCLYNELKRNNIKVNVDLRSINEQINFDKYDIVYIGSGCEDNLFIALEDIMKRKNEIRKYIEGNGYLILTGNSMDLFGKYILNNDEEIKALNIFDYSVKLINEKMFNNASLYRIVGEVTANTKLIKEKIIGFQNRCDLVYNVTNPLFEIDKEYSNDYEGNGDGIHYKNVYGTHIIGPLLIRNPYFTDYLLDKICKEHKLKFNKADSTAKKAYKKYLENFLN